MPVMVTDEEGESNSIQPCVDLTGDADFILSDESTNVVVS